MGLAKTAQKSRVEELELLSSGNEYNAVPHECKRKGRGKALLCPLGGDKVFMMFVQRGFLKVGGLLVSVVRHWPRLLREGVQGWLSDP